MGANAAWGVGPHGDNPMKSTSGFPEGDLRGIVVTDVQPPEVTDGCVMIGSAGRSTASPGDTFPEDPDITALTAVVTARLREEVARHGRA